MTNPYGRSAIEQAAYERACWPGTEVLRNKKAILDAVELDGAERAYVSQRVEQGFPAEATPYTYDGFKAMHRHMFQDIYDWAGQERTYTTGRGAAPFAPPEHISHWMQAQFTELEQRKFHMSRSREIFAKDAAQLVNEINAAHPFIDGNGRTQRQWLRVLARENGYRFDIRSADKDRWNDASRIGFEKQDHRPMTDLLQDRLVTHDRSRDHGRGR